MSKKVLLVHPSSLFSKDWLFARNFQLHLITLYYFLRQNHIEVDVLDLELELGFPNTLENIQQFPQRLTQLLQNYSFDIVGISCYASTQYLSAVAVAKACKMLNKECKVVVGGYHATALPEDFIDQEGAFDFIVRGEGEYALLEIYRGLYDDQGSLPRIIEGKPRDLSEGIFLDWENYKYIRPGMSHVGVAFSRGCPFRCSYCAESKLDFKYREYPVDIALRDIRRAVEMVRPCILAFYDPLFRLDTPWGQELFTALAKENFQQPIWLMTRIDMLKESHIDLLSRFNVQVFLGVETGSEKMLTIMNKAKKPKEYLRKVEENLTCINEKKVLGNFALLMNHPGETPQTVDETFNFFERILAKQRQVSVVCEHNSNFLYLPGTHVFENISYYEKEYGTVIGHKTWWKKHASHIQLAQDNIPSRGLSSKIEWKSRMQHLNDRYIFNKMATEAMLFKFWFDSVYQSYESREVTYA